MLRQFGPSTLIAVFVGVGLALIAFVPVAVYRYRRHGRLRLVDVVTLVLVACYGVALWSYTLIPLPESRSFHCVGAQLHPFAFLADIAADGRTPWRNRALLQVLFNVVLFVPFGYFLRVLLRRGWITATVLGAAVSLLIELTQKTGVWGVYRCAYRVFDVDDLILNTVGALLGSLVAIPIVLVARRRRPPARVTRVTLGRRMIGVIVDLIAIGMIGVGLSVAWRVFGSVLLGWSLEELPEWVDAMLGAVAPGLVEGYWVWLRGRTLGEAAVALEPIAVRLPPSWARLVKFLGGIGGYLIASNTAIPLIGLGFVAVSLLLVVFTDDHRGLSHLLAGMELRVEEASAQGPSAP